MIYRCYLIFLQRDLLYFTALSLRYFTILVNRSNCQSEKIKHFNSYTLSNSQDTITGPWGKDLLFEWIWMLRLRMNLFIFTCRQGFWVCPGWLSEDSVDWPCCVWWRWGYWRTLAGCPLHSYNQPNASSTENKQ